MNHLMPASSFESVQQALEQIEAEQSARRFDAALHSAYAAVARFHGARQLEIKLGQLLESCREWDKAAQVFLHVHEQGKKAGVSTEVPILVSLARCVLQLGNYEEARKQFDSLRSAAGDHPGVLAGLATIARLHEKDIDKSESLAKLALSAAPHDHFALHEMGEVLVEKKQTAQAVQVLECNIRRKDPYPPSANLWLATLARANRQRYARDTLEELMNAHPDVLEFCFMYAALAIKAGELSLARPALEKSLALSPGNPRVIHELGLLERAAGNLPRAQELVRQSLELMPDSPAALRTYLADVKVAYGDDNYRRLQFVAAKITDFSPADQIFMHYALAKANDDVGDFDTAFRHYAFGGDRKRKLDPYRDDLAAVTPKLLVQAVTPEALAMNAQRGCDSEVPVFIVGMPRSGTSLMEQVLSAHPDVFGAGELKILTGVLENIKVGRFRLQMQEPEPVFPFEENASWERRGRHYVDRLAKLAGRPYSRIVDKMPGNCNFVPLIKAILPNARIIHSRRHPVETCLSCYRTLFGEGHGWSYDLRDLGRFYRRYWDLMKAWRETFPGAMYEVRYEDNVADLEGQARRLLDYLGLEWNDNCLKFHEVDRPVITASVTQVRRPIYTTSMNRWRNYEKHLGPLLHELGEVVDEYEAEIADLGVRHS